MGAVMANTDGPRHNSDRGSSHVMPALIKKCCDAMPTGGVGIAVWGDGKPTREFLCVDGYAAGDLLVTEKYDNPAAVSIGAGFEITINELANLIVQLTGLEGRTA
jgi:GDP-L-fucose synthase